MAGAAAPEGPRGTVAAGVDAGAAVGCAGGEPLEAAEGDGSAGSGLAAADDAAARSADSEGAGVSSSAALEDGAVDGASVARGAARKK